ncbi:hypothetical protein OKW42_004724 [Paraburkholderia sp. WC7.3d]|uniref:Transposase n=1 Tax=Paraburkholderia podalyriae TaxID=1938811 RepID=A0ABR7Q139_9BURK|nr:hypothetical protein [Paraburkholderia podalyriae]
MRSVDRSLRLLVEKWIRPTPATPVRVIRFGRIPSSRRRYVCVEALLPAAALVIYFFLHDDGTWHVFPPAVERPAMSVLRLAA